MPRTATTVRIDAELLQHVKSLIKQMGIYTHHFWENAARLYLPTIEKERTTNANEPQKAIGEGAD